MPVLIEIFDVRRHPRSSFFVNFTSGQRAGPHRVRFSPSNMTNIPVLDEVNSVNDAVAIQQSITESDHVHVAFTIHGKPQPLPRPRFLPGAGGFRVYQPNAPARSAFRSKLVALIETTPFVQYNSDATLSVTICYRLKRPLFHFTGRDRRNTMSARALTDSHPPTAGGDLDNLVKFTVDAMQGSLFPNDRQIVHINSVKVWTETALSDGSTTVLVKQIT